MANYNKFRTTNKLTSKTISPPKFVIREEEFPALGNGSFGSISNNNSENFKSILLTQQIGNDEPEKRKIKYGWVELSFEDDKSGKIIKTYNKNYNSGFECETENNDEIEADPYKFNLSVINAIDAMIYRWENHVAQYNELLGEDAYEEFYKIGSEYMQIKDDSYSFYCEE